MAPGYLASRTETLASSSSSGMLCRKSSLPSASLTMAYDTSPPQRSAWTETSLPVLVLIVNFAL
eukprot:CAMPEP_0172525120 /NCGR_PEP_ID=MMETSP1067-20121228/138_1 /TAXON_ID=265564 ORGANISM="Thalassiosira punctigera, Strain Tpunct2005C2" /NCGR_SAMPLE_ID=MMETSP1067 /ASSEMBLY_ACC=CAM_ASM_000444 /LENGTH=63 /DNA_ID=CAMNT_0013308305 /DNA_START=28 /DNA_END=216 /DNA_ORIENTATION=+